MKYSLTKRNITYSIVELKSARKFLKNLRRYQIDEGDERMVTIAAYALMPNHFHLLITQSKDGGISTFLNKVCLSYSMYFNKKYARWGSLFGGRFRAKHVANDAYFLHLTRYIHRNPIPILGGLPLEQYPWTSYPYYLGMKCSDIVSDDLGMKMLVDSAGYQRFMGEYEPWDDQLIEDIAIDAV